MHVLLHDEIDTSPIYVDSFNLPLSVVHLELAGYVNDYLEPGYELRNFAVTFPSRSNHSAVSVKLLYYSCTTN